MTFTLSDALTSVAALLLIGAVIVLIIGARKHRVTRRRDHATARRAVDTITTLATYYPKTDLAREITLTLETHPQRNISYPAMRQTIHRLEHAVALWSATSGELAQRVEAELRVERLGRVGA